MALDGFFLKAYTRQLRNQLTGVKIEKIYQLSNDLVIHFRGRQNGKLRLSADSTHPRILLTDEKIESPETPPMFCMLLRKHLTGGIITDILLEGYERVITLFIQARNDFGEKTEKRLVIEIMGKHSNIILIGESDKVVDSIKRVNPLMSPRPIGPGTVYGPPPSQKLDTEAMGLDVIRASGNTSIQKAIYSQYSGISPTLAHSIMAGASVDGKTPCSAISDEDFERILDSVKRHLKALETPQPYLYTEIDTQRILDFSAVPLLHLRLQSTTCQESIMENFDTLLNLVYQRTNDSNRLVQKSSHLLKLIHLLQERLLSKIVNLEGDLTEANRLDELKLFGELLTANLHGMHKGMDSITVSNYYSGEEVTIPLDVTKGPNENAQRYYKRYNKAKTTIDEAQSFILQARDDYDYLEAVKILLQQAELSEDVDAIKEELAEQGFIKQSTLRKQKKVKKAPPHRYISTEGVVILVGRNNLQNDQLTLKDSHREHIWLHTKAVPGSHIIIQATFPEIDDATVVEAAEIAAYHSKARYSSQVPVDFTEVKYVKKPKGAKPGKVIYDDYKTIYVTPNELTIQGLRAGKEPKA